MPSSATSGGYSRKKMAKRKRSKKEIAEQARREAENDPIGRELRRHIEKIQAELRASQEPDAPRTA